MSKSKFKIGDKVKDEDGDIGIITAIWERNNAPNQILVDYYFVQNIECECDLERVEE